MPRRLLPLFLLANGCSTGSTASGLPAPALAPPAPAPGRALIVVWRSSGLLGSGETLPIAVDSQVVAEASADTVLVLDLAPGWHRVSSLTQQGESAVVMELEADSTYWFRASSRAGYLITEPGLERVEGAYAMKSVRGAALVWPEGQDRATAADEVAARARVHAQQGETQP